MSHTLLRAHKRAEAGGGELRLVIPASGAVPRIFTVTCLDRLIPCFTSVAEAVARSSAAPSGRRDRASDRAQAASGGVV